MLSYINWEKTRELQALPKYENFRKWLAENGVVHPSVEYPVAFGREGQLIGMAAKSDIPPLKAFLFVPHKLIINETLVKRSSIGPLIAKHPELYKHHYDAEYLLLGTYLMHELLKGEASFWHPYFEIVNFSDLPMLWSDDEVNELQD